MVYFHLRFDHADEAELAKHLDFILRLPAADKFVVHEFKTICKTPHTHAIFYDDRSMSAVRAAWQKKFPHVDGKETKAYQLEYCNSEEDPRKAKTKKLRTLLGGECYLAKGEGLGSPPDVRLVKGKYTADFIEARHVEYWKDGGPQLVQATLQNTSGVVIHEHQHVLVKPPRKIKPKFIVSVIDRIERNYPDRTFTTKDNPLFLKMLISMHGSNFIPYGPVQLENEMNILQNHFCFQEHFTHMYDTIKNRGAVPDL